MFAYYNRLSVREKRIYRESDRIREITLPAGELLPPLVAALASALESGNRLGAERAAQALANRLTSALGVPPLRVSVLERRPSWSTGELHGLYRTGEGSIDRVRLWMRTARRVQVVKFRTFLRTFLHELCHHLDYQLLGLEESFHTEGFYKRESSLLRQLVPVVPVGPVVRVGGRSEVREEPSGPAVRRRLSSLFDNLEISGE